MKNCAVGIAMLVALVGCDKLGQTGNIESVKGGTLPDLDNTRTLETVFSHYPFFASHTWTSKQDEQGRDLVVMTGKLNWSGSSCTANAGQSGGGNYEKLTPCTIVGTETFAFAVSVNDDSFEFHSVAWNLTASGGGKTVPLENSTSAGSTYAMTILKTAYQGGPPPGVSSADK